MVLIGEKLHKALYPKRDTLLAVGIGINVNTASSNSTPINIVWVDIFLFVISVSSCIVPNLRIGEKPSWRLTVFTYLLNIPG